MDPDPLHFSISLCIFFLSFYLTIFLTLSPSSLGSLYIYGHVLFLFLFNYKVLMWAISTLDRQCKQIQRMETPGLGNIFSRWSRRVSEHIQLRIRRGSETYSVTESPCLEIKSKQTHCPDKTVFARRIHTVPKITWFSESKSQTYTRTVASAATVTGSIFMRRSR